MSELSDYRRCVEAPMIENYEATIRSLRARLATAEEALEQARNNENFWRIRAKIAEGKEQSEALASLSPKKDSLDGQK